LYNGNTPPAKVPLTVSVPNAPTGTVFNIANTSGAFPVTGGTSRFLFATEHGQILGWPGSGAAQLSAAQSFAPGRSTRASRLRPRPQGRACTRPTSTTAVWTCGTARGTS
jgi:hypothetical protein